MRESSKAALGGIISALAVVIMASTYISPVLVYTAPAFAGLLLLVIVNEISYKWAIGTFVSVSLLSIFMIADKEAAVFFTFFFGYFPILSKFLEKAIRRNWLRNLIKVMIFNASCIICVVVSLFVFGISYDDFQNEGALFMLVFFVLMNVFFFVYDRLVSSLQVLYIRKLKKKFRKLFNIK